MEHILTMEGWFSRKGKSEEPEVKQREFVDDVVRVDGSTFVARPTTPEKKDWSIIDTTNVFGNKPYIYTSSKGDLILVMSDMNNNKTKVRVPNVERALTYLQEKKDERHSKREEERSSWDIDLT